MGPRLEPRTTMWSNLPNHQNETMKEGIPSESQSDSTNASVFKTILPACTASASCWHFASTAPELALDGQLPLPAGIPLPLAFRFPRPRAGAGWAASASCWHSASTAPELSLDGWLPLPAGMNGEHRNLFGAAPCSCGANPALGTPLSQIPKNISKAYQSLQMGPRLEPRTTMWSNLPNHQHETRLL